MDDGHTSADTRHELEVTPLEGLRAVSVALNRPSTLNALSNALLQDLIRCLEEIQWDRELRVVVLWGNGDRAFSSGSDIREFKDAGPSEMRYHCHLQHRVQRLIQSVPQIVIAGVHGYVLGGGLELALACDLRLSKDAVSLASIKALVNRWAKAGEVEDLLDYAAVSRCRSEGGLHEGMGEFKAKRHKLPQ